MALAILFTGTNLTKATYDEAWRRLREADLASPKGRTLHVSFGSPDNLKVLDIWDSQEDFAAFAETLVPIMTELGVQVQPEFNELNWRLDG